MSSGNCSIWTTDEAATGQVEYCTTVDYGSLTTVNGPLLTGHSVTITGLAANTLYHYRVKSNDAYSNAAVDRDRTFVTTGTSTLQTFTGNIVLGCPTQTAIKADIFSSSRSGSVYIAYGDVSGIYTA